MKKLKAVLVVLLVSVIGVCMQLATFADNDSIQITGNEVEKGANSVTLHISLNDEASLDAFHYWVEYDSSVLQIESDENYGYSQKFLDTYKTDNTALGCNAKDNKVIFAGASADGTRVSGEIASITFKILGDTSAVNEALTSVTLHVEKLKRNGSEAGITKDITYQVKVSDSVNPSKTPQPSQTTDPSQKPYVKGDADGNGEVELNDANMTLKAALKIIKLSDEEFLRADINADSDITLDDAQIILKTALGIIK